MLALTVLAKHIKHETASVVRCHGLTIRVATRSLLELCGKLLSHTITTEIRKARISQAIDLSGSVAIAGDI